MTIGTCTIIGDINIAINIAQTCRSCKISARVVMAGGTNGGCGSAGQTGHITTAAQGYTNLVKSIHADATGI